MSKSEPKKTYTMHDLPKSDRPRERMQKWGVNSLSSPELISVILGRGNKDKPVLVLAQELLHKFKNLQGIANASINELSSIKGIGPAKACQIQAAFELADRINKPYLVKDKIYIKTPEEVFNELKGKARRQKKEHFWALLLNTRNQLINLVEISIGSLDTSIVHPRELFKEAIAVSASSMIVAHNHPSGNPEASPDDIKLSKRLVEAGEIVGISIIDHIIIGEGRFISLKREGLL